MFFIIYFGSQLTLSKWGGPLSMGPRVTAVHREFTKRRRRPGGGGHSSLQRSEVVISAAGEGTLIFFAWQISNIMHCQIILNIVLCDTMAAFSIFRFALAHKLSRHRVPLAHQSRRPPHHHHHHTTPASSSSSSSDSSSPVSPFEYEVALGWLPQNKPLGEHGLAKLFTRVGILIEEYA